MTIAPLPPCPDRTSPKTYAAGADAWLSAINGIPGLQVQDGPEYTPVKYRCSYCRTIKFFESQECKNCGSNSSV